MQFASRLQYLLWSNNLSPSIWCFFWMKCCICFLYYSCVFSCTGVVSFFFPLSSFLNLKHLYLAPTLSKVLTSGFLVWVWWLLLSVGCWCGKVRWRKACCPVWRSWSVGRENCLLINIDPPWHLCSTPIQFSRSVVSNSLWPHGLQHARPPCPSRTPGVYSNSCPLSRWWIVIFSKSFF